MGGMFVQSLIDKETWDKAQWLAVAYFVSPHPDDVPYMGLVYKDRAAGRKIFTDLKQRLGPIDAFNELRVVVVEGSIAKKIPGYGVIIGSNAENTLARAKSEGQTFDEASITHLASVSRIHRLNQDPKTTMLPKFIESHQQHGKYFLIPVFTNAGMSGSIEPDFGLAIEKTELILKHVEDMEPNDRDASVFL